MEQVGVLTDTTASIPLELADQLGIELVSYYIHKGSETLRDMRDVDPETFAQFLHKTTHLPTTSNPSPGDYLTGLKNLAARASKIVVLTMTSKGSGAYQSCINAVDIMHEWMPELSISVQVIDSLKVAMAQGWAAVEAARLALTGACFEEVVEKAKSVANSATMIETADTLKYLYMGGRIGMAKHLVATLLNIKPLIGMDQGTIVALGTARSRLKAYSKMVELMVDQLGEGARIKVAFTHCDALDQLELLRSKVLDTFDCVETMTCALSPALAVHSGPGTVGLCYYPTQ